MALIKHGNNALSSVTAFPSAVPTGKPVLLSTATASSSSSIEFTSGIDSTYDIYQFEFIDIHPETNDESLRVSFSSDGGSTYGMTKTSTWFRAYHNESGSSTALVYQTSKDLAQSTSAQELSQGVGNANDETCVGTLQLFNPSSTTFVKHFIATMQTYEQANYSINQFIGGYVNSTSAIDAVKFDGLRGNFSGTIKMYGISA